MADWALKKELRRWRSEKAQAEGFSEDYRVFPNATIESLAEVRPASADDLLSVHGIGPDKARRYGSELLAVIRRVSGKAATSASTSTVAIPSPLANRGQLWTAEDVSSVRRMHAEGRELKFMAAKLGRTEYAIKCHLEKMGLPVPSAGRKRKSDAAALPWAGPSTPAKKAA